MIFEHPHHRFNPLTREWLLVSPQVVDVRQSQTADLSSHSFIKSVQIFENRGEMMRCEKLRAVTTYFLTSRFHIVRVFTNRRLMLQTIEIFIFTVIFIRRFCVRQPSEIFWSGLNFWQRRNATLRPNWRRKN